MDGNCPFGFSDLPSLSSHMTEEYQDLRLLQEAPGSGAQEPPLEGQQEPFEQNQSPQEPTVETNQPCQEVAEEVSQPCQEAPDSSQPCQDIPEEVSQPCQQLSDIRQQCEENRDDVNQTCQEVPQIGQPCQDASQLYQKISKKACELCQENSEEVNQPCQRVPVETGRLVHGFPVGVGGPAQEVLGEVGKPTQEIPEELSQSCQEFSVDIGRLTQGASAINLLSRDTPEVDNPPLEFPGEVALQAQEVSEWVNQQQSYVVPELIDQLSGEEVPQVQCPPSNANPQSQSLAPDQNTPLPPAMCDSSFSH